MSGIRVLHVVLRLGPGGAERLVIEMARSQQRQGPVAICCLDDAGAWATQAEASGVAVHALHRTPGFSPALGGRIADVARRHGATVIHSHQYSPLVYAALARYRLPGIRFVATEHGRLAGDRPTLKRRMINPLLSRIPDALVAVSGELRETMIAEGYAARRVTVIHNGVRLPSAAALSRRAARERLGLPPSAPVVGTVARLDPVKDLGTLLAAFADLRADLPSAVLVMIGDGPDSLPLQQRAAALGIGGAVRWMGSRDDARDVVAGFDVLANTSLSEGVSVSLLEGMACGVPVVATGVGGTPEVVVDGVTGLLVPSRDSGAVAAAFRSLLSDAGRREAMGRAGAARVADRFSFDRMLAQYDALYAERPD